MGREGSERREKGREKKGCEMRQGLDVVKLFEMLGIEEVIVRDDVKFLKATPRRQLSRLEQLPVAHDPRCRKRHDTEALRCSCVGTTRVRVRVPA